MARPALVFVLLGLLASVSEAGAAGLAMGDVARAGTHPPGLTGTASAVAKATFPPSETSLVACPPVITTYYGAFGFHDIACGVSKSKAFAFRKNVDRALSGGLTGRGPVEATTPWGEVGRIQTRAFRVGGHSFSLIFNRKSVVVLAIPSPETSNLSGPIPIPEHTLTQAQSQGVVVPGTDRVIDPVSKTRRPPVYPRAARRWGIQARVVLASVIDTDGNVSDVQVIASSVPGFGFEESAMNAVRNWRYEPATLDGEPVPILFTVSVEYSIQ